MMEMESPQRQEDQSIFNQYPELLKVCMSEPATPSYGALLDVQNTGHGSCPAGEGYPNHNTVSDQSVQFIPGSNGLHIYAQPPDSDVTCRWTTLQGESAKKCLSWTEQYSNLDFFRNVQEGSILYSPYSAVSHTQYMFDESTLGEPQRKSVNLYPGGATVPEHCLTNDRVRALDPVGCLLQSTKQPTMAHHITVPTKSSVCYSLPARSTYSSRDLMPQLVPSDLSPGNKSYHKHCSRPYPKSPSSAKYPQSPAPEHDSQDIPDIVINSADIVESMDDVLTQDVHIDVHERPDSVMSQSRPISALDFYDDSSRPDSALSNYDDVNRPNSALSTYIDSNILDSALSNYIELTRPDSALGNHDEPHRPDNAFSNYDDSSRPVSALSNYTESIRTDSALSNYVESIRPDSALSNYDRSLSNYDNSNYDSSVYNQSQRPGSAFSQFSEFDSGIDDSRSHLITPPPGVIITGSAPYTAVVDSSDDHRPRTPVDNSSSRIHTTRLTGDRVKDIVCPDENCVSSTSDDIEPQANSDQATMGEVDIDEEVVHDEDDEDEDVEDELHNVSRSSCSSGRLMIDTDNELDPELAVHNESNSDGEPEMVDNGLDTTVQHKDRISGVCSILRQASVSDYGCRTPVRTASMSPCPAQTPHRANTTPTMPASPHRPVTPLNHHTDINPDHIHITVNRDHPTNPADVPRAQPSQTVNAGLVPRPMIGGHVPGYPGYMSNPTYMMNPAMNPAMNSAITPMMNHPSMNPAQVSSMHSGGYGTYPYGYPAMWNCYPGMHSYMAHPYMPWFMGYPAYYPQMPYTVPPGGYMVAPPGVLPPSMRPGGIQKRPELSTVSRTNVGPRSHGDWPCDRNANSRHTPAQHTAPGLHPAQHTAPGLHPAQHTAPGLHPAQHTAPGLHPAQHTAPGLHPAQHTAPGLHPAQNTAPGLHPAQHTAPGLHPAQHTTPGLHPAQHTTPGLHPAQHTTPGLHPAQHTTPGLHPAQNTDSRPTPAQQSGPGFNLAQQSGPMQRTSKRKRDTNHDDVAKRTRMDAQSIS